MTHVVAAPRRSSSLAVALAVATLLGAFLGAVGPFGSYLNGPAHLRIAYWIGCGWIAVLVMQPTMRLAVAVARRTGTPPMLAVAAAVILANAPLAFLISLIARAFWPRLPPMSWFDWYAQVLAITAFMLAAYGLTRAAVQARARPAPIEIAPAPEAAAPFAGALCLQMEDHYVRVHTASGSRLVHGTLGQAMSAQGAAEGLQVHRSWWVARTAVRACAWEGRKLRLQLTNGMSVPVSRTAVARLRAAGWLTPGQLTAQAPPRDDGTCLIP